MGGFLTSEWFVWGEGLADTRDGFDEHFQSPHGEHLTLVEDDVENLTFEADKLYEFVLDWSPELWGNDLYMTVNAHHARMKYSFGDYKCENYMNMFVGLGRSVEDWSHDKRDGGDGWWFDAFTYENDPLKIYDLVIEGLCPIPEESLKYNDCCKNSKDMPGVPQQSPDFGGPDFGGPEMHGPDWNNAESEVPEWVPYASEVVGLDIGERGKLFWQGFGADTFEWDDDAEGWHLIVDNKPDPADGTTEYPEGYPNYNLVGWLDDNAPARGGNYHWAGREFYAEWEIKFNAERIDYWHDGFLVFGNHFDDFIKEQPTEWTEYTAKGNVGPIENLGFVCFLFDGDTADVHIRNAKVYFQ